MANAARDESMEDVLASIRRLVSEETERMPDMRQAASARPASSHDQNLDVQLGPSDDDDSDFDAAPSAHSEPPSERQPAARKAPPQTASKAAEQQAKAAPHPAPAARAKLLLTDDYMVEDMERWPDARAAKSDAQSGRARAVPPRSETRSPVARSRRAFDDADQNQIEDDIADFLTQTDTAPVAQPQSTGADADRDVGDEDDRPSMDERARARSERAERRRHAAARAAAIATETAARRASRPVAEQPAPQPAPAAQQPKPPTAAAAPARAAPSVKAAPAAPHPAAPRPAAPRPAAPQAAAPQPAPRPQPAAPRPAAAVAPDTQMVPFSMIERAVRASLEQYTADLQPPASPPDAEAELVLDEETLREMVSDIVRKELQGSLGERITRNVRKLVRREIYRALEARDLG